MPRKSKTRKQEKKIKVKILKKLKIEMDDKKKETREKLELWKNKPESEWTEARKARNGIKVETGEL